MEGRGFLEGVHIAHPVQGCVIRGISDLLSGKEETSEIPAARHGWRQVASIVNAVGTSKCKNLDGSSYWSSTAIIVTWDDWGGSYDHVAQ